VLHKLHYQRDQRYEDDQHHYFFKIFFDQWDLSEKISRQGDSHDSYKSPNHIVGQESAIAHVSYPCHKRRKRSDDRYKARKDDSLLSMFFKKRFGFFYIFWFDDVPASQFSRREVTTKMFPDMIIDRISQNSSYQEKTQKRNDIQVSATCKRSCYKQEAIPRKQRHDHKPCLYKNDEK